MFGNKTHDSSVVYEFEELKRNYEKFILNCPQVRHVKLNLFYTLADEGKCKNVLVEMARVTRPFLSMSIWNVLENFMDFMRNLPGEEGKNYQKVYENFTQADLVKRLLFKRPIMFCGAVLMRNCENPDNDYISFENVARDLDPPAKGLPYLREYISFDEILLASLICMSTPTFYMSDGSIKIFGQKSDKPYINKGVLCGLVGARNTHYNFLEHRFVFPRWPEHSTQVHKSDDFWIKFVYPEAFPEGKIPTKQEIRENQKIYKEIYVEGINVVYYEKRLMFSIIPYIIEATSRGVEMKKNVFCSVPPIGAGVWAGTVPPDTIYRLIIKGIVKYFDQNFDFPKFHRLKALALPSTQFNFYKTLKTSGKICRIEEKSEGIFSLIFKSPQHEIKIFNKIRYVAEPLPKEFEDCLSVAGYAWDGNSYPGNEYWAGFLNSFDPQAINCSLLGQFQNPEVNTKMADAERIKIY